MKKPLWYTWTPTLISFAGFIAGMASDSPGFGAVMMVLTAVLLFTKLIGGYFWSRKTKVFAEAAEAEGAPVNGLLRPCKACGAQFSKSVDHCPQCGHDNASKWVTIVAIAMAAVLVYHYKGGGFEKEFNEKVEKGVVADSLSSYELTEKHGSAMEICVAAGQVAEAYKMAGDESSYAKWQKIKKARCKVAGM